MSEPNYEQLSAMKYLMWIINVPKGTKCGYDLFALHRCQDFYGPDANAFRPERWGEEPTVSSKAAGWRYLPFAPTMPSLLTFAIISQSNWRSPKPRM
jgi:hypothetical protein